MRRRTTTVLGLVAATSLLTGCSASAPTPPTPSSAAPPTTTPSPTDADAKASNGPSSTGQQSAKYKGAGDLVARAIRVSEHDGFDRVVVELKGSGTPGWYAHYVATPRADGSGEVVDVRGDSFLGVSISGVKLRKGYPQTPADFIKTPRHFAPRHSSQIEDVNVGGAFEGDQQLFLGIDGDKVPFRVFALAHPSRLVVDVKAD